MQRSLREAATRLQALAQQVQEFGACSLPGVSIDFGRLRPLIERAAAKGFVTKKDALFVLDGLWYGFDLGIDVTKLKGKRWFRNYTSAEEHREKVTDSIRQRVVAHKTVALCPCAFRDARLLPWASCRVFPMGSVPKPMEPDTVRVVSDHTKSGLKDATDDSALKHTLNANEEIAAFFRRGYVMRMMDVSGAFPLLPLAPFLWVYFLHYWYNVDESGNPDQMWLFAHLTGDFGASGMPGTWFIFFSKVMLGVARSVGVLTLPMPVHVDDCALIGAIAAKVDAEGRALSDWLEDLGVTMKILKERAAAAVQKALGFWWDSIQRTRTLEEMKLHAYVEQLRAFSQRTALTLREMQQVSGRMQRAMMTLPRGAQCFLAALFALMRGLSLPWQMRRTSRAVRADFKVVADLLMMNLGRGFFCFDHMERAPAVFTDASKDARFAGGGYFSLCGRFRWWTYGSSAKMQPIDFLEGDAVLLAVIDLAPLWAGKVVPLYIDNRSFQLSAVKGWSKAARLYAQLRSLFMLALKYEIVFEFHWISTHDNIFADALSRREGEKAFYSFVARDRPLPLGAMLQRHESSGHVRRFGKEYSSDYTGDGPTGYRARPSPLCPGELGLFSTQFFEAGQVVVSFAHPVWVSYSDAQASAQLYDLPEDSFILLEAGNACCEGRWTRRALAPSWYRMNHAHPSIANVKSRLSSDGTTIEWYALRDVGVDEELRYSYAGKYPREWDADGVGQGTLHFSDMHERNCVAGKRARVLTQRYSVTPERSSRIVIARGGPPKLARKGRTRPYTRGAKLHGRRFSSDEDANAVRGQSLAGLSIQYTRASLFVGLPVQSLATRVDEILDNRLAASSHASIQAALGHWRVVCSRHRWPEVIASDDPSRGGKLAAFMLYCVDETELVGSSIMNYTWALRAYMKFCRQLDPAMGIVEWDDWTQAIQVVAWVQGEPRRMVPLALIDRALRAVDGNSFEEVQAAVLMVMLLFTFARSETPCPKTLGGFDPDQHLRVCDVVPVGNPFRLRIRLKRIKQDQRQERPEARGDGDWVVIGDTPDNLLFSIRGWTQKLLRLHGARQGDAPYFVAPSDRSCPLTYQSAMRHVRALLARVSSQEEAERYGLHSFRVTGYTLAKRGASEALAVAQGGWHSDAHERYDRFSQAQVLALPAQMLAVGASEAENAAAAALPPPPAPPAAATPHVAVVAPVRPVPAAPRSATRSPAGAGSVASASRKPVITPLTPANCVGRHVLCPRDMWPSWPCTEHGGQGWEVIIDKLAQDRTKVLVRFLAPSARTRKWKPMWLLLDHLRPI
jgi:hypothetical protein